MQPQFPKNMTRSDLHRSLEKNYIIISNQKDRNGNKYFPLPYYKAFLYCHTKTYKHQYAALKKSISDV